MKKVLPLLVFCVALSLGRSFYTNSSKYLFMNWNLFLAVLPFIISYFLSLFEHLYPRVLVYVALVMWLLFIPNGPYLITDIMHLGDYRRGPLLWFDLILFFSYAYAGLLVAMMSAQQVDAMLRRFGSMFATIAMCILFYVIAFGVYLGRFMRWNSWDLFYRPWDIVSEALDCLSNPSDHAKAYLMTVLFGTLLNLVYVASFREHKSVMTNT